ncbi:mitogen-activated protein kinase kinase kinase 4 isoform X2 [Euwallacea similis]|uniref:mitogen-activated protein kinase kinase kinase 4 isoform X2 n=1 Tax=Euwallacea similis TaxID=1736056 RepID=UPI00344FFA22
MEEDLSPNEDISVWDIYGKTPPRTKISRKTREKKQRYSGSDMAPSRGQKGRSPLVRRNTESSMYDEFIANTDKSDSEQGGSKRTNKRHLKLLRGSERDLKLDIASAQAAAVPPRKPGGWHHGGGPKTPSYSIESCKRFMCLMGRTLPCHKQIEGKIEDEEQGINKEVATVECPQSRVDFFRTLSMLIRMGVGKEEKNPRRGMSREESLWQTELKDLIWLELQAYHADRTPIEEDEYLCSARETVEPLLQNIMNYRFKRHSRKYSSQNSDSGVEDDCPGCNSIYCYSCMEAQNEALREIEGLMKRLEDAESLFPSSKAFAELYPLYNSPEFVSRVKAISLWFNMTAMQRLKLNILARLVLCLESKSGNWTVISDDVSSGSSSDSNNSVGSSISDASALIKNDKYNIVPLALLISKKDHNNISPYRRYIENILKTRALYKSLTFLEALHNNVLHKVELTLDKPKSMEIFSKVVCDSQEEELIRFGSWSPEAKNLDLPSYRSMFLFLVSVPLEVIKEYLQMRLEQKPENPSPLSVRQLMRELKEGLRIAATERERIDKYIAAVKSGTDALPECNSDILGTFEKCMTKVFKDYLDYLEQWVLFHHNTFQKNLLEEEFIFSRTIVKYIESGNELLSNKYANILGSILDRSALRLLEKIDEFSHEISKEDVNTLKQTMFNVCRELQSLFNDEREMSMKTMAFVKMFKSTCNKHISFESSVFLKNSVVAFKCIIPKAIAKVQSFFDYTTIDAFDEADRHALCSRIREILMQIYRFGFEFYKEMTDGLPEEFRSRLVYSMVQFAKLWMLFVTERCERGRGMRPRWANQGMEFLLTVCEPANTKHLTEEEFEDLKKSMDECISHLIGKTAPSTPESGFYSHSASPRMSLEHIRSKSRGSSPSPRPTYKSQRSGPSRKTSVEQQSPSGDSLDNINSSFTSSPTLKKDEKNSSLVRIKLPPRSYGERVQEAIEALENKVDEQLHRDNLIGKILQFNTEKKSHVRRRNVTFSWQRGIKIGQGRFGKVYTAVNNKTGEMMAVKEIPLQHNDAVTIKRVSDEMKILEGITHKNLVKYYGVEVYIDKMLLFMEFCAEGTLENLIIATENGLPELLVRKYTFQLLSGVACLHEHGIVHRDIKPANIFLTLEGNCLKIGDFGCAAKIKSNSTMPGELQGFVGTQAYMAPEVFTKNMNEGHGRAADIWSVGCVVIEMASAKRPWAQYDSNYQIMFKVGMGQSPDPPEDMIDEGLDFLDLCFKHNPKERASAEELLAHNFVKVGDDLI